MIELVKVAPATSADTIMHNVEIHLGLLDRLRVLSGSKIEVAVKIDTEEECHIASARTSVSVGHVLPSAMPWLFRDNRAEAGYFEQPEEVQDAE